MTALTNHATRWTVQEVEFLAESWDGTEETLSAVAELLERTVEACRQRYYEWTWGRATVVVDKPLPSDRSGRSSRAHQTRTVKRDREPGKVCYSCWLELPLTEVCSYCQ